MTKKSLVQTGKGSLLTESMSPYTNAVYPKHRSVTVEELQSKVNQFVLRISDQQPVLIALMGLPGVGKSSKVCIIQESVQDALGFQEPQELITYKQPDGAVLEVGGYICRKSKAIITTLHADHFFRALGADRSQKMLKDITTCRKLWGNPRAALRCIRDILSGKPTDINIYMGTPDEKTKKQPGGIVELHSHGDLESKMVIIAEGVNVGEWSDITRNRTTIKTLKILYDTSFEDSLIRILRRDHEKKGYSFQHILDTRLLEYYYILELYIKPALQDPKTILLDKKRDIPPFTRAEISEILLALGKTKEFYIHNSAITSEQYLFVNTLSSLLKDRFSTMHPYTPEEIDSYRAQKLLKKEKEKLKQVQKSI